MLSPRKTTRSPSWMAKSAADDRDPVSPKRIRRQKSLRAGAFISRASLCGPGEKRKSSGEGESAWFDRSVRPAQSKQFSHCRYLFGGTKHLSFQFPSTQTCKRLIQFELPSC